MYIKLSAYSFLAFILSTELSACTSLKSIYTKPSAYNSLFICRSLNSPREENVVALVKALREVVLKILYSPCKLSTWNLSTELSAETNLKFIDETLRGKLGWLAGNVCVSAVVPFRSRVLSHETKRWTKIKLKTNSSRHHCRNTNVVCNTCPTDWTFR